MTTIHQSVPWFYEAMKVDTNPHRLLADRIRLQMQLDFTPWIERMWFAKGKVRDARIAPKGETFFVLTEDDRTLRILANGSRKPSTYLALCPIAYRRSRFQL